MMDDLKKILNKEQVIRCGKNQEVFIKDLVWGKYYNLNTLNHRFL